MRRCIGDNPPMTAISPHDPLVIAGKPYASRLLTGTGKFQDLDETRLSRYMSLSYAPDPDLFIRTGGELRISNFLLWQSAYTEFHFTDCLWPDFDARALDLAIEDYARRDRRFGQVKVDLSGPVESGTAVGR